MVEFSAADTLSVQPATRKPPWWSLRRWFRRKEPHTDDLTISSSEDGKIIINGHAWTAGFGEDFKVQLAALEKRFRPTARGAEDGAKNPPVPPPHARQDEFHDRLVIDANDLLTRHGNARIGVLTAITNELSAYAIGNPEQRLKDILARTLRVDLRRAFDQFPPKLQDALYERETTEREFRNFRRIHYRTQDPIQKFHISSDELDASSAADDDEIPTEFRRDLLFMWGPIAILGLLEAAVSGAVLLSDTTPLGVWGGIGLSALIAAVNIGICILVGASIGRNLNLFTGKHVPAEDLKHLDPSVTKDNRRKKIASWLFLTIIFWPLTFISHLIIGVVRAVVAAPPLDAISNADNQTTLESISGAFSVWIGDPIAIVLTLVGIAVSVISYRHGVHLDDPYPGYGHVGRKRDSARARYRYLADKFRRNSDQIFEHCKQNMLAIQADADSVLSNFHRVFRQYEVLAQSHFEEDERTRIIVQQIADEYRESNIEARANTPPPTYFFSLLPVKGMSSAYTQATTPALRLRELQDQSARLDSIITQYLETVTDYQRVAQLHLNRQLDEFLGKPTDFVFRPAQFLDDEQASRVFDDPDDHSDGNSP